MSDGARTLKNKLRSVGVSDQAVAAAWPAWWSDEAETSASALAELRFSVARKLGLRPRSLFDEGDPVFIWRDQARFKGLAVRTAQEQAAITSFGISVARLLLVSSPPPRPQITLPGIDPMALRQAVLSAGRLVSLGPLIGLAWGLGIPVAYLRVFPMPAKRMTAMAIRLEDRYAILIGRSAASESPVAFYVAHELGHIASDHLAQGSALVDLGELARRPGSDIEEQDADRFAMTVLTGAPDLHLAPDRPAQNAATLANAVVTAGRAQSIDPGILAMCYGREHNSWAIAQAALRLISTNTEPVWAQVNRFAAQQLDLDRLTSDNAAFLKSVLDIRQWSQSP